ncbi:MAG: hypothetical protein ACPL8I_12665 [Chloroflexaceae bacterium]
MLKRQQFVVRIFLACFVAGLALLIGLWTWQSAASSASLIATPATPRQNDTVTLIGSGFSPGETVSIWITYPDFSVFGVAEVVTNGDGAFNFPYVPDFLGATFTPVGRYTYTAFGQSSGREVYASIEVSIGQAPGPSPNVTLSVHPAGDRQGRTFIFRGSGYRTNEPVAVWLRYPDATVEELGRTQAGPGGQIEYVLKVTGAPVGRYALTARGVDSGANGIAEFDVKVADLTVPSGRANLRIEASPDDQRSFAIFSGWGFQPDEIVTIWVTLPDASTLWIGDVVVDTGGAFVARLYLSEQEPVGPRTYTAFGNTSRLRATAEYRLVPGGGPGTTPVVTPEPDSVCSGAGCL